MKDFVRITDEGQFALAGNRWFCNSVIYFGHEPGAMLDWFTPDVWPRNAAVLDRDFARMAQLGINHAALFLSNSMFFDHGRIINRGFDCLDRVVDAAKANDVRITLFCGPFIDTPESYEQITGQHWEHDDRWLPSFNPALFEAYVQQIKPMVDRYKDEPTVLGYGDRIDRFYKGFDNIGIPFNLKDEWASWLRQRYGSFSSLLAATGGTLEGNPTDFHQVLLPQESQFNSSLRYPLAYDYILMQKKEIGDAQARWDARILEMAPNQIMWTPFEGCTLDWAMLDGFTPEPKKLHAIWMEYYHWQVVRQSPVGPYDEWAHTREFVSHRMADQSPSIYNMAYIITRYVKQSVQRPVVLCHGMRLDAPQTGGETEEQQVAMIDRVNAACLAADGDGWHYWCWTDDWVSSLAFTREQKINTTDYYMQGESMGLYDYDDVPRPVVSLVCQYSAELERRTKRPAATPHETLLLSSAAKMYSLYRRMATPTAAAVNGALARLGVEADYLWTAQNDLRISQETLNAYKLLVIADNMYGRDFRDMPEKLLAYVEQGGTLYLPLEHFDTFEDEHGVSHVSPALSRLCGIDPHGYTDWPGAHSPCRNWPYPTNKPHEPNFDYGSFTRLHWGICPEFRHRSAVGQRLQYLNLRSTDGDFFTSIPGLVAGAEVIAVGKESGGTKPFFYRHRLGAGMVYVNAWTNNLFRDTHIRHDYGGWDYDFILALPIETAGLIDVDITRGSALWLRNTWGYFWKSM